MYNLPKSWQNMKSRQKNGTYNTPIQEKTGSCMEARPKGPSAFAAPGGKNNSCRKKFQDLASKYWSGQIDTRKKNGSLKICRLKVNQVKF